MPLRRCRREYEAAGIALVAVSTNSPDDLKTTYQNTSDGTQSPFSFSLTVGSGDACI